MTPTRSSELARRESLWIAVKASGGPDGVTPALLRNLNVYSGARGIYTDADTTAGVVPGGGAVSVSLLHTGKVYADELSPDGVVYHYPVTKQAGKDAQEIAATKEAANLALPVFVITTSASAALRDVRLGWVTGWDDKSQVFLVDFAEAPPPIVKPTEAVDDTPFVLTSTSPTTITNVPSRPGQARFKFEVFRRYGSACAVCDLGIDGLLDAAHIRDKRFKGSDDPRNGMVLCALHHRALDRGLFAVRSDGMLRPLPQGPSLSDLGVTRKDLSHLKRLPHEKALSWRWKQWQKLAQLEDPHAGGPAD